jgi:ubiquinone/menaquinone biosynthesis C-methylase UbiE
MRKGNRAMAANGVAIARGIMPVINFPYIDRELERLDQGGEPPGYWRAFHWGLFPAADAPSETEDYIAAGEAMTEAIVSAAGVADGTRVLDVGCGFGGTIDHVAVRNPSCRVIGLNIDERQLRQARRLLASHGRAPGGAATPFITGDGCRLPVAPATLDHVLAVECVFHFASRKSFFKEVARVLRPGGTLALSDFVLSPGSLGAVTSQMGPLGDDPWFGYTARNLTSKGYERMGRAVGLDLIVDENVTERTMPTYPALRQVYKEAGMDDGLPFIDGCETLARSGGWGYHVLAFRRRPSS